MVARQILSHCPPLMSQHFDDLFKNCDFLNLHVLLCFLDDVYRCAVSLWASNYPEASKSRMHRMGKKIVQDQSVSFVVGGSQM
jgi:hypothetical protein